MGDSSKRDLCDILVSFFVTIHFEFLKTGRGAGGSTSDPKKNFLTDSHELNLWGSLKFVHAP